MRLVFNYRPVNHLALHKLGRRCILLPAFSPSPFILAHAARPRLSRPPRRAPRDPPFLSGQITPYDLRCNLQSAVRVYTAISPCKYATLFRMRMHSLSLSFFLSTLSLLPRSFLFTPLFFFLYLFFFSSRHPRSASGGTRKSFDTIPVLLGKL